MTWIADAACRSRILKPLTRSASTRSPRAAAAPNSERRSTRRLLVLLAMLPTAVLLLGTLYMLGMTHGGLAAYLLAGVAVGVRDALHHRLAATATGTIR
ncbi:MAG: hypothetical protein IPP44_00005 [Ideonella sp.]|nr:hypothetical protein [Ideonella sp.]